MIVFHLDNGFSFETILGDEPCSERIVLSPGSLCKVVYDKRSIKRAKRNGQTCILTGKYRTYNTMTYFQSSAIAIQVRFTSDNFCQWVGLRHLRL